MQAKDIPDIDILTEIERRRSVEGCPAFYWWDGWKNFPPKAVLAKCASLIKRGLLEGCACGCRGDFTLTQKGRDLCDIK